MEKQIKLDMNKGDSIIFEEDIGIFLNSYTTKELTPLIEVEDSEVKIRTSKGKVSAGNKYHIKDGSQFSWKAEMAFDIYYRNNNLRKCSIINHFQILIGNKKVIALEYEVRLS